MKVIILFSMIVCHLIADYNIQGDMKNLKQWRWWRTQGLGDKPHTIKYRHDYLIVLFEHSFIWSFITLIPWMIYIYFNQADSALAIYASAAILINTVIHSIIDDLKANKLSINLITDQLLHLAQIIITWFFL